jgi:TrmH family RNA methyltransferase
MISSRHNRKLKDIRRLRRCKDDFAVLEGPHLVGEAIASGTRLESLFVTPEYVATSDGRRLVAGASCATDEVAADALAAVTDADSPRGALAVAALPRGGVEALPCRAGIYVYLDGVQDPGNLGALARVSEATGAIALACSPGCAHPNHPRALRGSAGCLLRLPTAIGVTPEALAGHLATLAPRWVALDAHGGRDLYAESLAGTLLLALGAEGAGLSPALRARADVVLRIPMAPPVESLNVATAAAVVLFELSRRRRASV